MGDICQGEERTIEPRNKSHMEKEALPYFMSMSLCSVSRNCILSFRGVDDKKMREEKQSVNERIKTLRVL